MTAPRRACVVGGGAVGLACAAHVARALRSTASTSASASASASDVSITVVDDGARRAPASVGNAGTMASYAALAAPAPGAWRRALLDASGATRSGFRVSGRGAVTVDAFLEVAKTPLLAAVFLWPNSWFRNGVSCRIAGALRDAVER